MGLSEEIVALAQEFTGLKKACAGEDDVLGTFGLEGDDADEFLEAYAQQFGVDISDFVYYFHYLGDEPPMGRRVLPVDESGREIPWVPVTLNHLIDAASSKKWQMKYPNHTIRNRWWVSFGIYGIAMLGGIALLMIMSALL